MRVLVRARFSTDGRYTSLNIWNQCPSVRHQPNVQWSIGRLMVRIYPQMLHAAWRSYYLNYYSITRTHNYTHSHQRKQTTIERTAPNNIINFLVIFRLFLSFRPSPPCVSGRSLHILVFPLGRCVVGMEVFFFVCRTQPPVISHVRSPHRIRQSGLLFYMCLHMWYWFINPPPAAIVHNKSDEQLPEIYSDDIFLLCAVFVLRQNHLEHGVCVSAPFDALLISGIHYMPCAAEARPEIGGGTWAIDGSERAMATELRSQSNSIICFFVFSIW